MQKSIVGGKLYNIKYSYGKEEDFRMRRKKNVVLFFVIVALFITTIPVQMIKAANGLDVPTITLKAINKGTGVKITIGKTKGASRYKIYVTKVKNVYSKYMNNKDEYPAEYATVYANNNKTVYTIEGLPEGKYTFKVKAEKIIVSEEKTAFGYEEYVVAETFSKKKSITVKAAEEKKEKDKKYDFKNVKVGDTITFGRYEQDGNMTNGKESLEWTVLSKDKDKILVLCKNSIDYLSYNNTEKEVSWKNCTLRKWLNKVFFKSAFTEAEQSKIKSVSLTTKMENVPKSEWNTKDKVFLLSNEDIVNTGYGFETEISYGDYCSDDLKNSGCYFSQYASVNFMLNNTDPDPYIESNYWLLRSGDAWGYDHEALHWTRYDLKSYSADNIGGIRPALYIKIK